MLMKVEYLRALVEEVEGLREGEAWVLRAADRLALEVVKLTDSGRLGTRTPAADALLDYAQARHGQDDAISKVRRFAARRAAQTTEEG